VRSKKQIAAVVENENETTHEQRKRCCNHLKSEETLRRYEASNAANDCRRPSLERVLSTKWR
jgi:hypothetical protein